MDYAELKDMELEYKYTNISIEMLAAKYDIYVSELRKYVLENGWKKNPPPPAENSDELTEYQRIVKNEVVVKQHQHAISKIAKIHSAEQKILSYVETILERASQEQDDLVSENGFSTELQRLTNILRTIKDSSDLLASANVVSGVIEDEDLELPAKVQELLDTLSIGGV